MINKFFIIVKKIIIGILLLYTYNIFVFPLNIFIPLNIFTILISSIFGLAGVFGICLFAIFII